MVDFVQTTRRWYDRGKLREMQEELDACQVFSLSVLQSSTKFAKIKRAGKMRCCEKSGWPLSVKGGEAEVDKFLLKFLVCVVILALALSIKAC